MTRAVLVGGDAPERALVRRWLQEVPGLESVVPVATRAPIDVSALARSELVIGIVGSDRGDLRLCERLVRWQRPRHLVAVLTQASHELVEAACAAGASALVCADSGPGALAAAIAAVTRNGKWVDPVLHGFVLDRLAQPADAPSGGLTPAEHRVARCLPRGLTNRQIADELGIGHETVKTHVSSILRKLGVQDRSAAAARLVRADRRTPVQTGNR